MKARNVTLALAEARDIPKLNLVGSLELLILDRGEAAGAVGTMQAIRARRQLDRDRGGVSLWRLLGELRDHPGAMTRTRYVTIAAPADDGTK
jgi:hypothetical protein